MTGAMILWIYIVVLLAGGLVGFFKAGSKPSLIASLAFSGVLVFFALGLLPVVYSPIALGLLLVVFGMRLAKTKKFMPSGLMLIITVLALVAVWVF